MPLNSDNRWEKSFANFDLGIVKLREALDSKVPLSMLQEERAIELLIMSAQSAKDTVQAYLEINQSLTAKQILKEALAARMLTNIQAWMDMFELGNRPSVTYDVRRKAVETITVSYLPEMEKLHAFLSGKLNAR